MKYNITVSGKSYNVDLVSRAANILIFTVAGQTYEVAVSPHQDSMQRSAGSSAPSPQSSIAKFTTPIKSAMPGEVRAPMPGVVVQILVELGATVALGAPVAIVEAMKMENTVNSTKSGKVSAILVTPKQQVASGDVLVTIT